MGGVPSWATSERGNELDGFGRTGGEAADLLSYVRGQDVGGLLSGSEHDRPDHPWTVWCARVRKSAPASSPAICSCPDHGPVPTRRREPAALENGLVVVVGTGVDPVTYRFSGGRSAY